VIRGVGLEVKGFTTGGTEDHREILRLTNSAFLAALLAELVCQSDGSCFG